MVTDLKSSWPGGFFFRKRDKKSWGTASFSKITLPDTISSHPEKGVIGIRSFPVGMGEGFLHLRFRIFCAGLLSSSLTVCGMIKAIILRNDFCDLRNPPPPNATRQQSSPPPPKKIPRKTMSSNCLVTDLLKVSNSSGLIPSVFWRFGRPCWKETEGFWERFSGNDFETNSLKYWGLKKMSQKPTFLFLDLLKVVGKI